MIKKFVSFFSNYFRWKDGRQGTGYKKFEILISKRFNLDLHILRYEAGSSIPYHYDRVGSDYEHHRVNIVVYPAKVGGEFRYDKFNKFGQRNKVTHFGPLVYFRPDLIGHSVAYIESGTRYVLSIGFLKKRKVS
jgi:hypothetical protein